MVRQFSSFVVTLSDQKNQADTTIEIAAGYGPLIHSCSYQDNRRYCSSCGPNGSMLQGSVPEILSGGRIKLAPLAYLFPLFWSSSSSSRALSVIEFMKTSKSLAFIFGLAYFVSASTCFIHKSSSSRRKSRRRTARSKSWRLGDLMPFLSLLLSNVRYACDVWFPSTSYLWSPC